MEQINYINNRTRGGRFDEMIVLKQKEESLCAQKHDFLVEHVAGNSNETIN